MAIRCGLPQYTTGVRVTGQYPQWTIYVEDAVGVLPNELHRHGRHPDGDAQPLS